MPQHKIRIRLSDGDNSAVLDLDNNTVNVSNDLAVVLWNAVIEYLNNYCHDCKWFSTGNAIYKMGNNLMVKVRRAKDEIEFDFEE